MALVEFAEPLTDNVSKKQITALRSSMSICPPPLPQGTRGYPGGPQGTLGTVQYCTGPKRPAQTGPGRQIPAFQRFEPIIIRDFSWRFRKKALEKHISKQMRVYEQITFFYTKSNFLKICFPDRKIDFLRGGPIFGLKNREPEPDPGGPRGTPGYPRVCSYVRMSILVPLDRNIDNGVYLGIEFSTNI